MTGKYAKCIDNTNLDDLSEGLYYKIIAFTCGYYLVENDYFEYEYYSMSRFDNILYDCEEENLPEVITVKF